MSVVQLIRDAVESIPNTVYARATDFEANVKVQQTDLQGGLIYCVYNNLPIISYTAETNLLAQWPVVIKVLQLVDPDADTEDEDVIREAMEVIARQIYSKIGESETVTSAAPLSDPSVEFLPKVYDDILTGVELSFDLPRQHTIC